MTLKHRMDSHKHTINVPYVLERASRSSGRLVNHATFDDVIANFGGTLGGGSNANTKRRQVFCLRISTATAATIVRWRCRHAAPNVKDVPAAVEKNRLRVVCFVLDCLLAVLLLAVLFAMAPLQ